MHLINTIEILPYNFCHNAYESPKGSSMEFPNEWNQFWKQCISDKKLGRLEAVRKGAYFVDIKTINDDELAIILEDELKDVELWDYEEQVSPINGGIVLEDDNITYIEPSCCGDIGNINDWESIFESEANKWHQLWIGHPWIYYKKNNGIIEFSNYTELKPAHDENICILVRVSEPLLQIEFNKIKEQHNKLEFRIRKVLDKMGIANAAQIAKLMTGNV
ncbi:MAG: hypothetical protein J7623_12275 [Chitinophaga sp.]|uniref:hypothetical protein n=1 Tax=Chitinophaga sp. TaxID=1869181 RepID=UPI001B1CEAB2|nr:hypothetical protein [Chitinophaga sp.]MBO9729403.1 hypothetical protein [Chitinophaga sp.]